MSNYDVKGTMLLRYTQFPNDLFAILDPSLVTLLIYFKYC